MESRSAIGRDRPLGVIVIGTGFVADMHIGALRARADAELVGVVDVAAGRAAAAGRANGGIRATTDLAEALRWDGVDACIVCTPNATHKDIALPIAAAGKHLLIEKPLATTVPDAQAMAAAFEASGTVLMAAHTHRFYDYGRAVKRQLDGGAIGRPSLARLSIVGDWIWPDWRAWMLDPQASGGHSLHNGVHLLDLTTWWLDSEPVSIHGRGRKQAAAELEIYDYLELVVHYRNGATAICEMSRGHRTGSMNYRDVLIAGSDGILTLPWDAEAGLLITPANSSLVPAAASDGFAVQLDAWLSAVAGAPPQMTPADAVRAVAMGVAAEQSIATGEPVDLTEVVPV
ncbi:MAG TPA: Gfo/Idh/MocA family oxidoreductase [Mycobacteriales bacterium]|nr:Gfo/Idh/MocA family oxidoreductase [Mycobacteriales bacterium]